MNLRKDHYRCLRVPLGIRKHFVTPLVHGSAGSGVVCLPPATAGPGRAPGARRWASTGAGRPRWPASETRNTSRGTWPPEAGRPSAAVGVPRDKASLLRAGRCTRGSQGRGGSMPLPALTARFKERCPRPLPSWGAASLPSDPGSSGPHVVALWPSPPQCGAAAPTPFLCCFFLTTVISNWPWGGAPVPAPVARRSLPRRLLPNRYLQL